MASNAQEMALKQRDISISQFFEKNRHLLGFDNKRKALMTTIKEAVDNSLDACEEAGILPEVSIEIIDMGNDRYRVIVEDNGPGIVKNQIPKIFAKLLYGSKFFSMKQSRGQQGIGISASVLYAQLTTGKPAKILSKIGKNEPCHYYELHIDTQHNAPEIVKDETRSWEKEHGVRIELELEADYAGGNQSVDEYLKETAIANPHVTIVYTNPKAQQVIFPRAVSTLPPMPAEIKPHPYGVELGIMQKMLKDTESRTLQSFLSAEFSRVGSGTARLICENASLLPNTKPGEMSREMVEKLMEGVKKTKLIAPPTDCISPIGAEQLEKGLRKEVNAEFYATTTRPASVYRGNPFVVEAGVAYGGFQPAEETIRLLRFANRVPLLYQQGACAITKSVASTSWKNYGLNQSRGAMPAGPLAIVVHIASVWVPFTSESKEAIAHYPEIIKDVKLALQEVGRKLGLYINKKVRMKNQAERANMFQVYIPEVADSLSYLSEKPKEAIRKQLEAMVKKPEIAEQIRLEEDTEKIAIKGNYDDEDDGPEEEAD